MSPDILPISYIFEVTFYDFKFQICYTVSNNNNTDFICYRILSPSGYSHSFGLDINNPFINDNLRKNYSDLNQNNEYLYDNYLKSLIDRSINEYYIPINSVPYTRNTHSHIYNANRNNDIIINNNNILNNDNIINNENNIINNENIINDENNIVTNSSLELTEDNNNNNELAQNEISNVNVQMNNILFDEFRQNAESFIEDLYFLYLIPFKFQNHLNNIVYQTIWVVYETIVNIPDNYWEQDIIRLSETEFNMIITHEKMSNNLLEKLNSTDNTCSICLDKIDYNQKTTVLECNHIYHYDCAKIWFTSKCHQLTCPYCRCNIKNNNNVIYQQSHTYFT